MYGFYLTTGMAAAAGNGEAIGMLSFLRKILPQPSYAGSYRGFRNLFQHYENEGETRIRYIEYDPTDDKGGPLDTGDDVECYLRMVYDHQCSHTHDCCACWFTQFMDFWRGADGKWYGRIQYAMNI